jgi:peptidyl-prolyl cis-trans isomerase SDCCAG10
MANPGDNLSNSEAKEPKGEKADGGGAWSDELAEKERFAARWGGIWHAESRLHIGRRRVIMMKRPLHGFLPICRVAVDATKLRKRRVGEDGAILASPPAHFTGPDPPNDAQRNLRPPTRQHFAQALIATLFRILAACVSSYSNCPTSRHHLTTIPLEFLHDRRLRPARSPKMSNLYNLEPQPTAKVVLQTTAGDILLELFAKQIPLAARNFLQHCLDGYYDNTIFHRIVPGFIIQGGDPTGSGHGGESALGSGEPFADEFHSRLKYNRRGLLGMANSGTKNDNGSQFFITLGETPELAGKNTLFGRIVGDTIFNVLKISEAELTHEGSDRPLYPTKITGSEILVNPFDDMVRRERKAKPALPVEKSSKKKTKRKIGKALLSFGDDGGVGDDMPAIKKPKFNTSLVSAADAAEEKAPVKPRTLDLDDDSPSPEPIEEEAKVPKKPRKPQSPKAQPLEPHRTTREEHLKKANEEIAALKASLRRSSPGRKLVAEKPKSALEAMIPATSTHGRKRGPGHHVSAKEEAQTLALFKAFKSKLDGTANETAPTPEDDSRSEQQAEDAGTKGEDENEEAALCDLHFIINCQSCSNWTNQDDEDDEAGGWLSHKLSFAKDRLGKDLEWKRKNEEELVVVDPREKARDLGVERAAGGKDSRSKQGSRRDGVSYRPR